MFSTIIAGTISIVIIFALLKLMERLEPIFPVLEQKWVEKVTILVFPILWLGLEYGIYTLIS